MTPLCSSCNKEMDYTLVLRILPHHYREADLNPLMGIDAPYCKYCLINRLKTIPKHLAEALGVPFK